jgi:hypothetical protein
MQYFHWWLEVTIDNNSLKYKCVHSRLQFMPPKLRPWTNTPSDAKTMIVPLFPHRKLTRTSPLSQEILPLSNYLNYRNVQCGREHGGEVPLRAAQWEWDEKHLDYAIPEQEWSINVTNTNLFAWHRQKTGGSSLTQPLQALCHAAWWLQWGGLLLCT